MVETTLSNSELSERPSCPRCESTMWITRIGPDVDKRVLECPVCDILEIAVVNIK
jgi:transposase-like protein